ncbi:hypothetical protein LEN26_014089 [Aphanomyces euteiches]|nr:hypothetical protein AeMF1_021490 [Aphanomyces euteiches]KAH9108969.1 hypothetical protein LEN26_014089 [Aphanomyces euteiches]KAH9196908.1 hypothetical protein AeNC1_001111 [Aphanomyces euteiches]
MEHEVKQQLDLLGAQIHAKWKKLHMASYTDRVSFATKLRNQLLALQRHVLQSQNTEMQIPDDLLAGNDDTKDTNEEEQFYQHWASHERFNLDQAYIRQLAQIEDDYQQHLEVLQNHLTNSKMSGSQDQLTVQVKQVSSTLYNPVVQTAHFTSSLSLDEHHKLKLDVFGVDLHMQLLVVSVKHSFCVHLAPLSMLLGGSISFCT